MLRRGDYDIISIPILCCFHIFASLWDTYFAVMHALNIMHKVM